MKKISPFPFPNGMYTCINKNKNRIYTLIKLLKSISAIGFFFCYFDNQKKFVINCEEILSYLNLKS